MLYANARSLYIKGPEFWDFVVLEAEAPIVPLLVTTGQVPSPLGWNSESRSSLPKADIPGAESLQQVTLSPLSTDVSLLSKEPSLQTDPRTTLKYGKGLP